MCSACRCSQAGLCWRVHVYSTQLHWQHSLQGTRHKWTDLFHHAHLSMCTSRDKMAASGMELGILIEYEFVAVVSWKVCWLCFFYTKFALIRPDDWWVSFTHPWAVSTSPGQVVNSNTTIFCTPSFKCQLFFYIYAVESIFALCIHTYFNKIYLHIPVYVRKVETLSKEFYH